MIRETYLANLKKGNIPLDKCIMVCRGRGNDELAPSAKLLGDFNRLKRIYEDLYSKGSVKAHNTAWDRIKYADKFKVEIYSNPKALKRLREIAQRALKEDVYLVCYEKHPKNCHRMLLIEYIMALYRRGVE